MSKFLAIVATCRAARYAGIALVAEHYGRHFIRMLRHPTQYWGWLLLFAAVSFVLIAGGLFITRRLTVAAAE